jgi:hypothetical protein
MLVLSLLALLSSRDCFPEACQHASTATEINHQFDLEQGCPGKVGPYRANPKSTGLVQQLMEEGNKTLTDNNILQWIISDTEESEDQFEKHDRRELGVGGYSQVGEYDYSSTF